MVEVGGCALCKDRVVEGDPYRLHLQEEHNTTLEEIFEEGRELGENLVACNYCDEPVEKGDVYRILLRPPVRPAPTSGQMAACT